MTPCPLSVSGGDVRVIANAGATQLFVSFCHTSVWSSGRLRCLSCQRLWVWIRIWSSAAVWPFHLLRLDSHHMCKKTNIINSWEAVFWLTVEEKMGLTTTHTSTHSHSSATHTHTSSHSARLPDNNPLSAVTALVWILNPPVLDKEDASDYVRNEKLQEMFPLINSWCHSSCISCTIVHPDWPQTPAALTTPGTDPGYICWTDAMRHG